MDLGNNLYNARKKRGLSQERVAKKLGVSRQTISKWETNETLPDIQQSKKMAQLYHLTLDGLIDFDVEIKEIQDAIEHTSEEKTKQIDWTKLWGQKYPVLNTYKQEVEISKYAKSLKILLNQLKEEQQYSDLDAMLVLKDILSYTWKDSIE